MREANRLAWGLGGHDSSNHNGGLGGVMDRVVPGGMVGANGITTGD